jgi:hypothetical protein
MKLNLCITPWSESASELYRPSDRRLSAKLVPKFADRGCHVVSVTDPYCRILCFLDRKPLYDTKLKYLPTLCMLVCFQKFRVIEAWSEFRGVLYSRK